MKGQHVAKRLLEADEDSDDFLLSSRDVLRLATPKTFKDVCRILSVRGYHTTTGWSNTFGDEEDYEPGEYPLVCLKEVPTGDGRTCLISVEPYNADCYVCLRDIQGKFYRSAHWDFDLSSGTSSITGFLHRLEEFLKTADYYENDNADKILKA